MPQTIYLANGTTLNRTDALASESNILAKHGQFHALLEMYKLLWQNRSAVGALVASHVGVSPECIEILHHSKWYRGGFNLVVVFLVKDKKDHGKGSGADKALDQDAEKVLLRVPIPKRLGEEQHPGSVADKLRCEVGSYIWMQRHCPEVRIPHLHGFGIPGTNGAHFAHASRLSLFRRIVLYVRQRVASWLHRPVPSVYLPVPPPVVPVPPLLDKTGYMVIEHLSEAKFGKRIHHVIPYDRPFHVHYAQEPAKTRNLFRGVARTMLALARVPQPRIGAFRFCPADGSIRLDGRPIPCDVAILEGEGAPRTIGLDTTYTSADRYVADLARFQESAFRGNVHAVVNREDGEYQMAIMAMLRSVTHCFVEAEGGRNSGQPFVLHLSDNNPGNMLVNDDWEVTAMFDLEWLFAIPVAQLSAPRWLTWDTIDRISSGDGYDSYCASRTAFMDVFREEERKQTATGATPLGDSMDASWASQRVWFYLAYSTVSCMSVIFQDRLRNMFWPQGAADATDATDTAGMESMASTASTADSDSVGTAYAASLVGTAGTADSADSADSASTATISTTTTTDTTDTTDTDGTATEADAKDTDVSTKRLPYETLYRMWHPDAEAILVQKLREREEYTAAVEKLFSNESSCCK